MAPYAVNVTAEPAITIWTVGHSNHELATFVDLLVTHEIEAVADVRSAPYSRFAPHFDKAPLERAVREAGIEYVFLGQELGGRPPEDEFYDAEGHVRYDLVAGSPRFLSGIDRLLDGGGRYRIAMMCSEEDPHDCHRRLLVARVLCDRGVEVRHIRGDGAVIDERSLAEDDAGATQQSLFGDEEPPRWRSTRSVSRSGQPRASSEH